MARKKLLSYARFRDLCEIAIASGATPRANGSLRWDISGGCYAPVTFELKCHNDTQTQHRYIDLDTRCRLCDPCLKARAALWRLRMAAEIRAASRTWFVTLTLDPGRQSQALLEAQHRLRKAEVLWTEIDERRRFAEVHKSISPEITRFVKRVRERSGARLRLICVAERHKSGNPHYHALLHEPDDLSPVRHRHISDAWRWGFSQAKLVADNDAGKASAYVAKYLTKSSLARVRASRGYGRPEPQPEGDQRSAESDGGTLTNTEASVTLSGEAAPLWWCDFIASLRAEE